MTEAVRLTTASWIEDASILLGFDMDDELGQLLWEMAFSFSTLTPPVDDELKRTLYGQFNSLLKRKTSWKTRSEFLEHFRLLLDVELGRRPGGSEVIAVFEQAVAGRPLAVVRPEPKPVIKQQPSSTQGANSSGGGHSTPSGSSHEVLDSRRQKPNKPTPSIDDKIDALLGGMTKPAKVEPVSSPVIADSSAKADTKNESSEEKLQRLLGSLGSRQSAKGGKPRSTTIGRLASGTIPDPDKHDSLSDFLAGGKTGSKGDNKDEGADAAIDRLLGRLNKPAQVKSEQRKPKSPASEPSGANDQKSGSSESQDEAIRRLLGL